MRFKISLFNLIFVIVFTIGMVFQLAIIVPSGWIVNGDMLFWSSHGHDSMWHIAVANEIQAGIPIENPAFAGEKLVNYHLFSDIPLALINSLTNIPKTILYFQILPIIYSFLLGLTAYLAGKELGKSRLTGLLSVFSVYFVGSLGFLVTLWQKKGIGGESLFWATQVQSSIGNPPQILADIFLLSLVVYLSRYLNDKNKTSGKTYLLLILLPTLATISKIYAGIVIYPSLILVGIYRFLTSKKTDLIVLTIISGLFTLLIYLPFSKNTGSFLIWEPLWYGKRLFLDEGRFGLHNFAFILQHYQNLSGLKPKIGLLIKYDLPALVLMIIGNLGIRSIGFFSIPSYFKRNKPLSLFLLAIAFISFIFPNLFLQKGVATNTSQILQYLLIVFGLYFAIFASNLFSKSKTLKHTIGLAFFILAISIPTQIGLLYQFYSRPAYAQISSAELDALKFIRDNYKNKRLVILTAPYNQYYQNPSSIVPEIWDWFDTSYVAAISEQQTYFSDYEQVDIMGYDYLSRKRFQQAIFESTSADEVAKLLKTQNIHLVYFPKALAPKIDFSAVPNLTLIFSNSETEIWATNK